MMISSLVMVFYMFFCSNAASTIESEDWKMVKENEYMKVWTRKIPGNDFKEIRIKARMPATMKDLIEALEDVESHTLWVFKASKSSLVRKIDEDNLIYHVEIDMPFPVVDRDAVLSLQKIVVSPERSVQIVTRGVVGEIPEQEKFIRITDYHSEYLLKDLGNGEIELDYQLSLDPAGKLPAWVINLAAVKGPVKTMEALYTMMKNGAYTDH